MSDQDPKVSYNNTDHEWTKTGFLVVAGDTELAEDFEMEFGADDFLAAMAQFDYQKHQYPFCEMQSQWERDRDGAYAAESVCSTGYPESDLDGTRQG